MYGLCEEVRLDLRGGAVVAEVCGAVVDREGEAPVNRC
jgi:hypothetical protein